MKDAKIVAVVGLVIFTILFIYLTYKVVANYTVPTLP